jgi:ribose transport system ATP-binding protein
MDTLDSPTGQQAPANDDVFLSMRTITKDFPGVRALCDVTFEVRRGQVHALVGENGAGKSTLVKILCGAEQPTAGRIFIDGKEVVANNPVRAQRLGLSIIYQEFNLVPGLSVAENIFLGRFPRKRGTRFVDFAAMRTRASRLLDRIGMDLDPRTLVSELSVAEQQMVEIAKALSIDSKMIVMDEPSATLTEREIERLFEIIHSLKDQGVTTVYISHRLDEIFSIADCVTVMRDGVLVGTRAVGDITKDELISMMVGRELAEVDISHETKLGSEALKVEGLSTRDGKVHDVSFALHEGEILGMYGLVGAGRTETAAALFGLERPAAGRMWMYGRERWFKSPRQAIRCGLGLLPEDRKQFGLVLLMTVRENTTLGALRRFVAWLFVRGSAERRAAQDLIERLSIRTYGMEQEVMTLSGGNQQKVVLAKVLCAQSKVLIFDEPTRGVDVGAKAEIYRLMADQVRKEGAAVLMISSELPEVLGVADRILVMREGRINGEFARAEATEENVIRAALGAEA